MTDQTMTQPHQPEWLPGPLLTEIPDKTAINVDDGRDGIVVIHFDGNVTAFRNSCLHQDMPIHSGYLTSDGVLLCPWHNWCYQVTTGECLNVPGAELHQFPVQVAEGRVWIKVKDSSA